MKNLIAKKKYDGIDIIKFLMAVIVVASHTQLYSRTDPFLTTIYDLIRDCVVPFFFLASGFFLYKETNQEEKLKSCLNGIIKLYFIWSIIYLPFSIYEYINKDYSLIRAVLSYTKDFLFKGQHYYSWQLWYLLSFIYALIGIIFLKKRKLSDKQILIVSFLIYLLGIIITNNYKIIPFVSLFNSILGTGRLFTGMFLIYMGIFIRKYNITLSKFIIVLLMILCFIISVIFPNEISKLILYITVFLLAMQINNLKINTIFLRKCSTIFYYIHMLNIFAFMLIVGESNAFGIYSFLINLVICFIEAIIILLIQKKWDLKFINVIFNWPGNKKIKES